MLHEYTHWAAAAVGALLLAAALAFALLAHL